MRKNHLPHYLSFPIKVLSLALLAFFLYFPFFNNDFIFDDYGLFKTGSVFDYVEKIFDIYPRTFPYFTLGIFAVISEGVQLNRVISLILHIMCGCLLYVLIKSFLLQVIRQKSEKKQEQQQEFSLTIISLLCSAWFLLHPLAVYGAGYLAQRTILFATLFSLLSLWFYRRAFAKNKTADIFTATLFYFLAVMSKEHAIMLPFAAVAFGVLYEHDFRPYLKRAGLYILLCAPVAIWVFFNKNHIVATGYEPDVAMLLSQMSDIGALENPRGKWFVSVVLQAFFFFKYIFYWFLPDIGKISIDMRFDFSQIWASWWIFPVGLFFCISPFLALNFLRKRGAIALFSCGYLYVWFLFLTELASVRFQEPFVLYRSYLWAPGYAFMLAALCIYLPRRWAIILGTVMICVFFILARDRLNSLESDATVWKDAAQKLNGKAFPGSDRIYYNRGRAFLQEKKYEDSINDFSQSIKQNPTVYQIYLNRALAYYALMNYEASYIDIEKSIAINKKDSSNHYVRGLILEQQGCVKAAASSYQDALNLGNVVAKLKIEELGKKQKAEGAIRVDSSKCPS